MSERKVLNKYYPPDFDPSKIPRLRLPKTRQYTVRIMTPCNMRCNTCGDYIAKAKKFNARKETVEEETYLGLKIFRFYFKCPTCMAEITFKTDPKTCDYELEHGATRNFQALRLAEQQAERESQEKEEEEKLNPMKMLENRTKASRREMEELEALEELKDISERKILIDHQEILERKRKEEEEAVKKQEEEDEAFVRKIMAQRQQATSSHFIDGGESDEEVIEEEPLTREELSKLTNDKNIFKKEPLGSNPTSTSESFQSKEKPFLKRKLNNLVKIKEPEKKTKPDDEKAKVVDTNISAPDVIPSNPSKLGGLLCSYSDSDESCNDS